MLCIRSDKLLAAKRLFIVNICDNSANIYVYLKVSHEIIQQHRTTYRHFTKSH